MSTEFATSLQNCFRDLPDPRVVDVVTTNCWILLSSPFVVCYVEQMVGKSSLKQKRFRAAMDDSFLWQLLTQV